MRRTQQPRQAASPFRFEHFKSSLFRSGFGRVKNCAKKPNETAGPAVGLETLNFQKSHCGDASSAHFVNVRF